MKWSILSAFLAPHTSGPRDVPRCGEKTPHYRGDPAETAVG
jgi:hypothetical protein